MTTPLDPNLVLVICCLLSFCAIVAKLWKWCRMAKATSAWLTSFQMRYFVCYFSFMFGLTFQGPYVYQRYLDSGLEQPQIAIIMSTFNIVSSLWGFVVGHATKRLGHKKLVVLSACLLGLHAILRWAGGYFQFILASAVMGVSTASNRVVFEDWLLTHLQSPDAPPLSLVTVQENSALIRLILTVISTPVSAWLTGRFGTGAAFAASALMFLSSALINSFLLSDANATTKAQKVGYFQSLKVVYDAVKSSRELVIMMLIDIAYSVFYLLYSPRWLSLHQLDKNEKLPLSQMGTTSSVAPVNAAQLLSAVLGMAGQRAEGAARYAMAVTLLLYLASLGAILAVFPEKNFVYIAYICAALCDGGLEPVLRISRGSIYPRDVRGYILGLLRCPNSLIVSGILLLVRSRPVTVLLKVAIGFMSFATFLAIVLARRKSEKSQE
jgi:MFS family permease